MTTLIESLSRGTRQDAYKEITGMWVDHQVMLTLATDHTFNYHSYAGTSGGTWSRDDWNLYLKGTNFGGKRHM